MCSQSERTVSKSHLNPLVPSCTNTFPGLKRFQQNLVRNTCTHFMSDILCQVSLMLHFPSKVSEVTCKPLLFINTNTLVSLCVRQENRREQHGIKWDRRLFACTQRRVPPNILICRLQTLPEKLVHRPDIYMSTNTCSL